ncbi:44657_t:CDS:2, partial [Gigaspora margarita]
WAKAEFCSGNTDLAVIPGALRWMADSNSITKKENLKRAKSDKDDECDGNKSDSDESDSDESDSDEFNNRVGKWPECFVVVEKL